MSVQQTSSTTALDVQGLSIRFGPVAVVDGVSFAIKRGEFVGLTGPNGAGKSTLIKALLGIAPVSSGTFSFAKDLTVCYVPQHYALPAHVPVSVGEVVRMGEKKILMKKAVHAALANVGLTEDFVHKNFHELSGGQKQRVMIARALIAKPDMIFFDEPLSGIDFKTKMQIYDLLKDLNKKGMTILFISHDVDHVVQTCDRVLCLDRILHKGCHPADFARGKRDQHEKAEQIDTKCLVENGPQHTAKQTVHHHHSS